MQFEDACNVTRKQGSEPKLFLPVFCENMLFRLNRFLAKANEQPSQSLSSFAQFFRERSF